MQSRKLTVLITIALFMAITIVPKVSAEEVLKAGAITVESAEESSLVSDNSSMIDYIRFILDAIPDKDLIEALLAVTLSEEDAIDLFTTIAMVIEIVAGMIFAAILSTFIALIVILLTLPLTPITGMVWDIFVLLIILYYGISRGANAAVRLDNATGISALVAGLLSRIYFLLTPLWQALHRILAGFCFNPEEPEKEVPEEAPPAVVPDEIEQPGPATMVVTAYPTYAYHEEPVTVEAQLLDSSGQPVGSGYEVAFSADAGTIFGQTNEAGIASATIIVDTAGEVLVTATYVDPETLMVISGNTTIRVLPPAGTISGMVTDGYNNLFAGVEVELYLNGAHVQEAVADANGVFTFQDIQPNAPEQFYELRVSSDRTGTTGKAKAVVESGYTTTANVVLPLEIAPGFVEGQVTDSVGNPVGGAEVSVDGMTTVADEEGNFAFKGLYPGEYAVTAIANASAEGESAEMAVIVYENEIAYITIALPIPGLEIIAPENVTEGDSFNVTVTLNGQPVAGAFVTAGNETVVTKIDGTAQLTAPEVDDDKKLTISALSADAEGSASAEILVKSTTYMHGFEVIVIVTVIVIVALIAIFLAGAVIALRRRKR